MHIGLFDPYSDTPTGGEKYMYTIAEFLSQDNHVDIFWDKKEDIEVAEKRFGIDLSRTKIVPNIFSPRYSTKQRIQAAKKYDRIIYLSDGSLPLLLKRNLIVHFQYPVEWVRPSFFTKAKFAQVKQIICNSKFTQSFIDKKFDVVSSVLYPPVEIKAKDTKKEQMILHVGRFSGSSVEGQDYKKQHTMIEVFKSMVDKGLKGWEFCIAASVRDEEKDRFDEMEKSAEGYPIRFLINQTNTALWELYSKAKIYWHASGFGEDIAKHPEYAEHFGISTVEAMGAGAVPVVIGVGGQKEIITDGVDGLLWTTKKEWIEKTEQVISDQKLWKSLSEKAQIRAKDFSKEAFCKKLEYLV